MSNDIARWDELFQEQTKPVNCKEVPIMLFCNRCKTSILLEAWPAEALKIYCRTCRYVFAQVIIDNS